MHRSGTSALTRVLSLLGAGLPKNLLGSNPTNPAGHWEPQKLIEVHDRMLAEAGSRWDDWRAFDPTVLGTERLAHYRNEIKTLILEEFGDGPLFVLKDPRICRFVPLYEDLLAELRIAPVFIHTFRNPLAVTASLEKRDGMTEGFASLVWLRHVLDAEIATRGKKRAFLSYEDFLDDWKATIIGVTQTLKLDWPRSVAEATPDVEGHLSQGLQHHVSSLADLEANGDIAVWVRKSHAILLKVARGEAEFHALRQLSRIKAEFDTAAPVFGRAMFPEIAAREATRRAAAELLKERDKTIRQLTEREAAQVAALQDRLVESDLARERDAKTLVEMAAEKIVLEERLLSLGDKFAEARRSSLQGEREIVELKKEMASSTERLQGTLAERDMARGEEMRLQAVLQAVYTSTSWRVSSPLRGIRHGLRAIWRGLRSISGMAL